MKEAIKRFWRKISLVERLTVAVILVSYAGVLGVGLQSSEPLIGDEVTHYYLLLTQAKTLPTPTIKADIPLATGRSEKRNYPHVFLWHYAGAWLVKVLGASFFLVQVYHSLFWLQLLFVAWLLVRKEPWQNERITLATMAVLGSLPMGLLFSVAFYQDIPALAQILTSFLFLRRRKIWHSILFMCFALCMKETVFVFLPVYVMCIVLFFRRTEPGWKTGMRVLAACVTVLALMVASAAMFKYQLNAAYYPRVVGEQYVKLARQRGLLPPEPKPLPRRREKVPKKPGVEKKYPKVANNPGDLRSPVNFLVYGGGLFWLVVVAGGTGLALSWRRRPPGSGWWLVTGTWALASTAWMMKMAPDARFFLPGMVFIVPPLVGAIKPLQRSRSLLAILLLLALAQGSAVLARTWQTRHVPKGVFGAIQYLKDHPLPAGLNRVFMYPEGSYRLFPCAHEWYLSWRIKEFWKANNDGRIQMLQKFRVSAIVIKKYRVGHMDPKMNNLGIYPDFFVRNIENDQRFAKVYENSDVIIYLVPAPPPDAATQPEVIPASAPGVSGT